MQVPAPCLFGWVHGVGALGGGSGVVPHNACGLRGCCGLAFFWQGDGREGGRGSEAPLGCSTGSDEFVLAVVSFSQTGAR